MVLKIALLVICLFYCNFCGWFGKKSLRLGKPPYISFGKFQELKF